MFTACKFAFDGVSCSTHGLMLYDIGGRSDSEAAIGTAEIEEAEVPSQSKPFFYGVKRNKPLEFTLTFGADMERMDSGEYLDKPDIGSIVSWLCRDDYKKLTIDQTDMAGLFYRCIITELTPVSINGVAWAFTAAVRCDAPYAYRTAQTYSADVTAGTTTSLTIAAQHDVDKYYRPVMTITPSGSGTISVTNGADDGRSFVLSDLPSGISAIRIDNDKALITTSGNQNIYTYCNFRFLRLLRGNNILSISGGCHIEVVCEYPAYVGA